MSYRLQISHGSLYGLSQQITQNKFCNLAAILFFKILSKFVQTLHTNFYSKSGVCSSKNEQVMALGTKEDGHLSIIYIQAIIQSKLHFSYSQSLDKRAKTQIKWIFVPAISHPGSKDQISDITNNDSEKMKKVYPPCHFFSILSIQNSKINSESSV